MDKNYIHAELLKRNISHEFIWTDLGSAIKMINCIYKTGGTNWITLLPIDDAQDEEFVNAVEAWRKTHPVMMRR
jgi:hypothetical protein